VSANAGGDTEYGESDDRGDAARGPEHEAGNGRGPVPGQPSLNAAVRRRRTDREFFLRVRDAIAQNHRALERLSR